MKILVLEDEILAAEHIEQMLLKYFEHVDLSFVKSITAGKQWLDNHLSPDLIFSDIELLDGNVFTLYEQVKISCPIIFVTAYDKYLLQAFQTNGIAYLLKPFKYRDLVLALEKYKALFPEKSNQILSMEMLQNLKFALDSSQKEYKNRFVIKKKKGIFLLNTSDIVCFTADDDIVFAFDNKKLRHIVNYRMSELESILNPRQFFRINRSAIVHIKYIQRLESFFKNRLVVHLEHFSQTVTTSGSKTAEFRKWIEG